MQLVLPTTLRKRDKVTDENLSPLAHGSFVEERLKSWLKALAVAVQQKFDLSQATIPPFEKFALWFGIGASAVFVSAVVNVAITKYFFFPTIQKQISKSGKDLAQGSDPGNSSAQLDPGGSKPALVMVIDRPKAEQFNQILKRNLFNSEQKEEVVKDSSVQSICTPIKSDLPLKFTGVIFGGTKETSLVLLESISTKQADTFIVNDIVPGEAKIVDIQRDKVFFFRGSAGCPEYLDLQQPEAIKKRVPNLARSHSSGSSSNSNKAYEFSEAGFARSRDGSITADRRWVDKALTGDFAKTLQDAKASPNLVNGEVKGFVLTRIRPDSVYEKMGFQDGDVVEQINGIDLNDAARAIQTLNSLKNENAIELNVKRNGVTVPLKIQVK